jgi:hypothetical protein
MVLSPAAFLATAMTVMTMVMAIVTRRRHRIMVASRHNQLTNRFPRPPTPEVPMLAPGMLSVPPQPLITTANFLAQVISHMDSPLWLYRNLSLSSFVPSHSPSFPTDLFPHLVFFLR